MKFDQLNYFLATAKTEHIGKAAKALAISPSAVSHSIAQLEEELGRELFLKKGKRIFLTAHGRLLQERAEALFRQIQSIQEEVASEEVSLTGNFRLAASHDLSAPFLTKAWAELQREHPKLHAEIYTLRSAQIVANVLSGEIDLGMCFSPMVHPDLNAQTLHRGELWFALRKDHPLFKAKPNDRIGGLSRYPAVLPKAFQGIDVCERHPIFEKCKIRAVPDLLVDSYSVALTKVANSDSWGYVPDYLIQESKDFIRALRPTTAIAYYTIASVWRKDKLLSSPLKRLSQSLEEHFKRF